MGIAYDDKCIRKNSKNSDNLGIDKSLNSNDKQVLNTRCLFCSLTDIKLLPLLEFHDTELASSRLILTVSCLQITLNFGPTLCASPH